MRAVCDEGVVGGSARRRARDPDVSVDAMTVCVAVDARSTAVIGIAELPYLPEDWSRAIAVVAHPDDLEYGAASAIARWMSQGKDIRYVLATRGEAGIDSIDPERAAHLRTQEQEASAAAVGVSVVEFLDHPDGLELLPT